MSFRRLLRRSFLDVLDPAIFLTTFLLLYLTNAVVSIPLIDALTSSLVEYIYSGSLLKSLYAFFASLSSPLILLSFLVTVFLNVYLVGFIVARIWQKRVDKRMNPFTRAVGRWAHTFIGLLFVSFLPFIFLIFYALYQPYPIAGILYTLLILSLFLWIPLAFPVLTAAVVEEGRGRDVVYEGLLAGKLYWWKILLGMIVFSFLVYIVGYVIQPLYGGPWDIFLNIFVATLMTVWLIALAAEAYYGFKHGE